MEAKKLFKISLKVLEFGGIYTKYEKSTKGSLKKIWTMFVTISFVWGCIGQCHFIVSNIKDFTSFTDSITPFVSVVCSVVKIITFYVLRDEVHGLVEELKEITIRRDISIEEVKTILKWERNLVVFFLANGVISIGTPVLQNFLDNLKYSLREFPFKRSFFIDLKQTPVFQIEYINTIIVACCVVICYAITDILFFTLARVIVAHLKNIQNQFKTLMCHQTDKYESDMKTLINYHTEVMKAFNQLNKIFTSTLVMQFLVTSMCICLVGFQFRLVDSIFRKILSLAFISGLLLGLLFYDIVGQQLITHSAAIFEAVYDSNWYDAKISLKNDITIMLMMSRRPLIVKVGFYTLSLNTFMSIINSMSSYIVFLESFM